MSTRSRVTTNGFLLERDAEALVRAGVDRFNVSVDSLQRDRFYELTRRDALAQVLRGLERLAQLPGGPPDQDQRGRDPRVHRGGGAPVRRARAAHPVRGAVHRVHAARRRPRLDRDQVLTGAEIRAAIDAVYPLEPEPREPHADRSRLPVRRRPGPDRLHQPGLRAVLRRLQPHPPDRRRPPADLPVLAQRDRPARPDARRRGRSTSSSRSSATRSGARSSSTTSASPASSSRRARCPRSAASRA